MEKNKTQNKTKEQSETILTDEDNVKAIIFFVVKVENSERQVQQRETMVTSYSDVVQIYVCRKRDSKSLYHNHTQIFNKKQVPCKQGVSVAPAFLVHSTEQQASRLHWHYCC